MIRVAKFHPPRPVSPPFLIVSERHWIPHTPQPQHTPTSSILPSPFWVSISDTDPIINRTVSVFSEPENFSTSETMEGLPQGYRPNVGVCLISSDDKIFVASRLNVPGAWQMPQGGIEDGEEPKSAAIRELREETGIVSADIIAEVPKWLTYDFPTTVKNKVNRLWGGQWHGQAQKWFLIRLTKDDSEVNLANGEAEPEFAEWKWASPEEVIEQAVDYKRPTYEEVIRTFTPYFQGNAVSAKCKSTKW